MTGEQWKTQECKNILQQRLTVCLSIRRSQSASVLSNENHSRPLYFQTNERTNGQTEWTKKKSSPKNKQKIQTSSKNIVLAHERVLKFIILKLVRGLTRVDGL